MPLNILGKYTLNYSVGNGPLKRYWSRLIVIHGYVQTAATVARNTRALKDKLSDIANLHYVDGPPMRNTGHSSSRPWWILDSYLEHDMRACDRWDDTVCLCFTIAPLVG
jgi:Serine hydrolase (FSH1)